MSLYRLCCFVLIIEHLTFKKTIRTKADIGEIYKDKHHQLLIGHNINRSLCRIKESHNCSGHQGARSSL